MEWYRVIKTIRGRRYIYDQKTYRENGRVRTLNRYIGRATGIQAKCVYHGTLAKFENFDLRYAGSNTGWDNAKFGIFFIDDPNRAGTFVQETRRPGDRRAAQIKEAYLDIKKPLDLTHQGIFQNIEQAPTIVKLINDEEGMRPDEALAYLDENIGLGEIGDLRDALYRPENITAIRDAGYDGIISTFGYDDAGKHITEYVVFDPNQVKVRRSYVYPDAHD